MLDKEKHMKLTPLYFACAAFGLALSFSTFAESASIAPKFLLTAAEKTDAKVVCDAGVTCAPEGGRHVMTVAPGEAAWPTVSLLPANGTWDLSPWGHLEVELQNPGKEPLSVGLRIDNPGDWKANPWNAENVYLKPGEKKVGKVIFGYSYGFQKAFKLDPSKVSGVKIFLNGKKPVERKLVIGDVMAAGGSGEKPAVDPSRVVVKPAEGRLFPLKGEKSAPLTVADKPVKIGPKSGYWNLGDWLRVSVKVKNTGPVPVTPAMKINANGEPLVAKNVKTLAPGETAIVELPFIPSEPWHLVGDAKDAKPTGGTKFESHRVRGMTFTAKEKGAQYQVVGVRAAKVEAKIPAWLGKRPPVPGKWKQTLAEEFNDGKLNEKVWSPYSANYWDKRTHFTRENILFRDGCCVLKYEKKTGPKNDDPTLGTTDYACGILDSYDHWTQLYGYFESRMKLPKKPGLWPAFWTMPDRGPDAGKERWMRTDTHKGGMEFDILEHLTAWGPYRFNIACHWDGYGKEHRAVGTSGAYVPTDKDGFMTIGMLWLPGVYAIYANGVEILRWESERVANVPAHIFFYMVSGGWANEPLDDDELPDEFVIDWFRVWQLEK